MMTSLSRTLGVAGLLLVLVLGGCSRNNPEASPAAPSAAAIPEVPAPIGALPPFLAAIDDAGGCSSRLVEGVAAGIAAINYYGRDIYGDRVAGTATVTDHQNDRVGDVPVCRFTIDPGNTDLPPLLITGGLTANKNTLLSTPTPEPTVTAETDPWAPTTEDDVPCTSIGDDVVGEAAEALLVENDSQPVCGDSENRSDGGIFNVSTREVSLIGEGGHRHRADGYFAVAVDHHAVRVGRTADLATVFAQWIGRGPAKGSTSDFTLVIA